MIALLALAAMATAPKDWTMHSRYGGPTLIKVFCEGKNDQEAINDAMAFARHVDGGNVTVEVLPYVKGGPTPVFQGLPAKGRTIYLNPRSAKESVWVQFPSAHAFTAEER